MSLTLREANISLNNNYITYELYISIINIPEMLSTSPGGRWGGIIDKSGCQARPLTIVGNLFGECHTPCMLETSFVDFYRVGA